MIDYKEAGVTEPEPGIIEFEVTPEHIEELRGSHIRYNGDTTGEGEAIITCSESAAVALQIALMTGKFRKASKFRSPKFQQDWKEYKPKKVKEKEPEYAF